MKKKTKIFIAFIVIVVVAVGAIFLLNKNNSNMQLYKKMYSYTYETTNKNKNIVNEVDDAIVVMLDTMKSNGTNLEEYGLLEEKANFEKFLEIKKDYNYVQNQILNNGNFVTNANSQKYLKPMNKAYSNLINIYKDGYNYLEEVNFSKDFLNIGLPLQATYIESFNISINEIVKTYNDFMYNAGMAYAMSSKNLINSNNYSKLKLSYYVTLINNSLNLPEEKASLLIEYKKEIGIFSIKGFFSDSVDEYVENNQVYDNLIKNFKVLNIVEIVDNEISGTINTYIESIENPETRELVACYVTNIIKG